MAKVVVKGQGDRRLRSVEFCSLLGSKSRIPFQSSGWQLCFGKGAKHRQEVEEMKEKTIMKREIRRAHKNANKKDMQAEREQAASRRAACRRCWP